MLGPWRGDAVFVVPAGVTGVCELVEVGLAGRSWPEFVWGAGVLSCCGLQFGQAVGGRWRGCGFGVADGSGSGQDVQSEVAAAFGPFVVLFGQDRSDEADDGVSAGEDADNVCAPADFAVEAFVGIIRPDLAPQFAGEGGEGQYLSAGTIEVFGHRGQLVGQRVDDTVELGVHRVRVGEAPELASVINDPDNDGGVIDELAGSLIFDIRDLADIYAYRESLRR